MAKIQTTGETKLRVAVLLTFPEGTTLQRAQEIANYWSRTALAPGEEPELVEALEFLPDRGRPVIYQP